MGKDKKRKLSETSSSVGELQRQGNFKIDPEEIPKALDDSSWPYVSLSLSLIFLNQILTTTHHHLKQTPTEELHQVKLKNESLHSDSIRTQSFEETFGRLREVRML